ncbi:MAG: NAD(P)(+) transhydrogenase (Re/Si-specific) subunit alpha, partial [Actinobacteria bacterium]|nr:NAD(P)(+) transhydrogenase (Re/Si-specific) subunit alpha [Actinomycetota bacterium]
MKVAVPRETAAGERRVALVPEALRRLGEGFQVSVERGAGTAAGFPDDEYETSGAVLVARDELYRDIEAVVRVASPAPDEIDELRAGTIVIGFLSPLSDQAGIERLAARGIVGFAMESIPRITRAQGMDALSSQSTVAGYKAAVLAADRLPRLFPLLMTAAGTVAPAKVLVLGAGVAGLQAIATARRLGAVVSAFDTRPVVQEQVESLGASFLDLGVRGAET